MVNNIVYSDSYIEEHLMCYVEPLDNCEVMDSKIDGTVYEWNIENINDLVGNGGLYRFMDEKEIYISTELGDFCLSNLDDCKEMKRLGILVKVGV